MFVLKQTDTFRKWQRKLRDETAKALIAARLLRLANGIAGDVAPVGDGVSELRVHYGPGYRIYFKRSGAQIIVLLCGGDKQSQQRDIKAAKQLAADWRQDNA